MSHPPQLQLITYPICLFTALSLGISSSAQTFGEAGTEWEHCFLFDWEIPATFYDLDVQSIDTYDIDTLSCSTLVIDDIYGFTTRDTMTVCSIGDRVYYIEYDSLVLLYDFSLQPGDTLIVKVPELLYEDMAELFPNEYPVALTPKKFLIESIEIIDVDGHQLRRQHIELIGKNEWVNVGPYISERFGFKSWIFPYISIDWAEFNPGSDLMTYRDATISYTDTLQPCMISSLSSEPYKQFSVFPNPASTYLQFSQSLVPFKGISVRNVDGLVISHIPPDAHGRIDISVLRPGLYILNGLSEDAILWIGRFIKF